MIKPFKLFTATALLTCLTLTAHAAGLSSNVNQLLQKHKLGSQSLSAVTIPLNGQGAALRYNADIPVNPASTMKLVTTYAALELLGPSYRWNTDLLTDGNVRDGVLHGNLYLRGGGDPKLNMEKLWMLLRDLRLHGVRQVTGDLILDRSYFALPTFVPFDDDGDEDHRPYLVTPDSLLVNFKAVRLITRNEGGKVSVAMDPPLGNIRLDNRVQSTKAAPCSSWPDIQYTPAGNQLTVTGRLPAGCSAYTYLSMLDHPHYAEAAVRSIWTELGGKINGSTRMGKAPGNARLLARSQSPDLAEVIRDINKFSNNTMARQLFLSIGARHRQASDSDDAAAAKRTIRSWLASKGLNTPNLMMENGSGLSRNERITANEMASILQSAWNSPYSAEFISSLPLAGLDGTLRRRMKNTPAAGQAHLKTGTLRDTRAIAGYTRDRNGKNWVVVAIINDPKPWGTAEVLDQLVVDTYKQ